MGAAAVTAIRTPLFELHRRLGARMTEFGGFEMPLSYAGIIPEHRAVRAAAGLFDLSHMGEFELRSPGALALLERAFTNSAARLRVGQAQYTIMCAPDGGTLDDLIVYRLAADRYMLCVNASNIAADMEWLLELGAGRAGFRDLSAETALIAVQGPRAIAIVNRLAAAPADSIARFAVAPADIAGAHTTLARTGYTGEDGFEVFLTAADAPRLFEAMLDAGRGDGLEPCGLGARDTLRMEAGLPLYGHELDRATTPIEAGLSAFVKFGRDFVGAGPLADQKRALEQGGGSGESPKRLIGLRTDDGKTVARQGYRVFRAGIDTGVVTSGTYAPSFDRPLAMAYLNKATARVAPSSDTLEVEIRNRRVAATIVPLPFYRRAMRTDA